MYRHHNPQRNKEDYNYYVRCVNRFRDLLRNDGHKLFIMMFVNQNSISDTIKNNILDFNSKFGKYTQNYTLLVIIHYPNKQQHQHIFTYNDNIHFLELYTLSVSNGVEFINNGDNIYLDGIIKSQYKLN